MVSPILTVVHAREVCGADDKFGGARACVNVRIGEFMLGMKLPAQCMLGRRGQFEGVAFRNAESGQPCI